jgi:hypothetical protein
MIVNIQLGTTSMQRLKEFVDWLDKAPITIENLDFSAQVMKGDVTVNIKAPRVHAAAQK